MSEDDSAIYDQTDNKGRYLTRSLRRTGGEDRREDRPTMYYGLKAPDGTIVFQKVQLVMIADGYVVNLNIRN